MVHLVLFDIDGTLIRTGGAGVRAFARTFATEFRIPNATEGISFSGRTDPSLVRQCFSLHGIPPSPENFERFFDVYVFWLHHFLEELAGETCPGVFSMILSLQESAHRPAIGLLTGNVRLGAEIKLRRYGLWPCFRVGAFGDDNEDRNQLALIAQGRGERLLKRNLDGEEILVIGDTPLDIACARAIKARVLAVATGGYSSDQLRGHQPDWLVENLDGVDADALVQ